MYYVSIKKKQTKSTAASLVERQRLFIPQGRGRGTMTFVCYRGSDPAITSNPPIPPKYLTISSYPAKIPGLKCNQNANNAEHIDASELLVVFHIMIFITFTKHKPKKYCTLYERNNIKINFFKLTLKLYLRKMTYPQKIPAHIGIYINIVDKTLDTQNKSEPHKNSPSPCSRQKSEWVYLRNKC